MHLDPDSTLGALAATVPGATRVLSKHRLDYCCRGGQSLRESCARAGLPVERLLEQLEEARREGEGRDDVRRWSDAPLSELLEHVLSTHHTWTRAELARLTPLADKVARVHRERHPELLDVRKLFEELKQELEIHMLKEERVLFPYLQRLFAAAEAGQAPPPAHFGTLDAPVRVMTMDHDAAGEILVDLRQKTGGYAAPVDACGSFRALYQGLEALDRDLVQHVHLENNLLFPRALELWRRPR